MYDHPIIRSSLFHTLQAAPETLRSSTPALYFYPRLFQRHRFIGPWTYAEVAIRLLYLAANLLSILFGASAASEVATRAGSLSLINMVPVYFGIQMSFAADLHGVHLSKYRVIHTTTGCMSVLLGILHALIHWSNRSHDVFGLMVGCNSQQIYSEVNMSAGGRVHDLCTFDVSNISLLVVGNIPAFPSRHGHRYCIRPVGTWCVTATSTCLHDYKRLHILGNIGSASSYFPVSECLQASNFLSSFDIAIPE